MPLLLLVFFEVSCCTAVILFLFIKQYRISPSKLSAAHLFVNDISTSPQNDVPPPGAYYRPSTMERDGRICGSVSAKGFGSGFVSATPRFRDVKMLQEACLPGPGSYNAQPESGLEGGKLTSFSSLRRVRSEMSYTSKYYVHLTQRVFAVRYSST